MSEQPVRTEDAFDVEAVAGWLSTQVPGLDGVPEVKQFSGGASNLTYLLTYPDRRLVLRRPPKGAQRGAAHDMAREYRVQQRLKPVYRYVPQVLALCEDEALLGSDFYVMEHLQGTILRGRLPKGMHLDADQAHGVGTAAVEALLELHRVDPEQAGLADLAKGAGYVRRQVTGWNERYRRARTPDVPDFEAVMSWLDARQPDDVATRLVHNDFRLDNLVLDDDLRVVGVLDWEMATLGDPLMDLGGALAYWVQADDDDVMQAAKRQPTDLPGMPTRQQVLEQWAAGTGLPVGDWTFYEVFGLFRLAAICQQIYARFVAGSTTNPAFANFGFFVAYLEGRCRERL